MRVFRLLFWVVIPVNLSGGKVERFYSLNSMSKQNKVKSLKITRKCSMCDMKISSVDVLLN